MLIFLKASSTEAVYLHDASLRTLTTEIVSHKPVSSLSEDEKSLIKNADPEISAITMRQTILYPQGGGQPSDTGSISLVDKEPTFTVSLVRKTEDGRILHFGKSVGPDALFAEGQSVVQQVDGAKRDYHSRLHTGGHIVGLAMQLLFPEMKKVKANHFPKEACMEYEGLLYNEQKPLIQAKVNELVQQDLPVLISWVEDGSDLNGRGALREGPVRVASIGGLDQNPCGGTHVPTTSLTGPITIRKISRQKGISRVSYEVPLEV
jgi:Ser-tRNA(Ala) deacylase AlaX